MPVLTDFVLGSEDGTLTVSLAPPTNISGWSVRFLMMHRFGGSGLVTKSAASGFNNTSGINVTNGAQGVFNVSLFQSEVSGQDFGNYAYKVERTDSGSSTVISEGFRMLIP